MFILLAMSSIFTIATSAQPGTIKGRVLNQQKQPMAGASVQINGKTVAKTNDQGDFTINCQGEKHRIRVSFIWFSDNYFICYL